eukprot:scaffold7310_cov116-Isochrysis_galbana.AAC.9
MPNSYLTWSAPTSTSTRPRSAAAATAREAIASSRRMRAEKKPACVARASMYRCDTCTPGPGWPRRNRRGPGQARRAGPSRGSRDPRRAPGAAPRRRLGLEQAGGSAGTRQRTRPIASPTRWRCKARRPRWSGRCTRQGQAETRARPSRDPGRAGRHRGPPRLPLRGEARPRAGGLQRGCDAPHTRQNPRTVERPRARHLWRRRAAAARSRSMSELQI